MKILGTKLKTVGHEKILTVIRQINTLNKPV